MTCAICHFDTELDDVVVGNPGRQCVCLRCYLRETASEQRMPKALRREIIATLAAMEAA